MSGGTARGRGADWTAPGSPEASGVSLEREGQFLNDQGYRALKAGQLDEAAALLVRSIAICRQIRDWEGEVIASENLIVALLELRRWDEALEVFADTVEAQSRAQLHERMILSAADLFKSIELLDKEGNPYVVRDGHRDEDVQRAVDERGKAAIQRDGVLIVDDGDILAALSQVPRPQRLAVMRRVSAIVQDAAARGGRPAP